MFENEQIVFKPVGWSENMRLIVFEDESDRNLSVKAMKFRISLTDDLTVFTIAKTLFELIQTILSAMRFVAPTK
jgi:hypothetical protein